MDLKLKLPIQHQPDDTTCGPTCLQAVYGFYGDELSLDTVISDVQALSGGGTLAVFLARHALKRGYGATIFTYNLRLFDPTWFADPTIDLADKLRSQAAAKNDEKIKWATKGYLEFLELGGQLQFRDLTDEMIYDLLATKHPVLTGLSATYLYSSIREYGDECQDDDIRGEPVGHFVVLCGFNKRNHTLLIADPMQPNPMAKTQTYSVDMGRCIASILLGALTHDANLLILDPPQTSRKSPKKTAKERN
jgi:hypothetical protein